MYSTEIGELAHKEQIKKSYPRSNKKEAAQQILSQYGRQHGLGMCLHTIEAILKTDVIMLENSEMEMPASASCSASQRRLQGGRNIGTLAELCRAHEIEYCDMIEEMPRFIKEAAADAPWQPADSTELGLLPVEPFSQLAIAVSNFQKADVFQIHQGRCTETKAFCNGGARKDWVLVQSGLEKSYGDLPT